MTVRYDWRCGDNSCVDRPWKLSRLEKSLFKRFELSCRMGIFSNYCIENSEVRFKSLFSMWARRTVIREATIFNEQQEELQYQQRILSEMMGIHNRMIGKKVYSVAKIESNNTNKKNKKPDSEKNRKADSEKTDNEKTVLIATGRIIFNGKECYRGGDHIARATLKQGQQHEEKERKKGKNERNASNFYY